MSQRLSIAVSIISRYETSIEARSAKAPISRASVLELVETLEAKLPSLEMIENWEITHRLSILA